MINYTLGNLGHLSVIMAFLTAICSGISYALSANAKNAEDAASWQRFGRWLFFAHAAFVFGIGVFLYSIIAGHHFEYQYAYAHSSIHLPAEYLISCFWEGQEGSFLLWLFWHALIGVVLIYWNKKWESPLLAVFALVQAFLASMILGIVIGSIEFKIGSSPFILFKDVHPDLPVWKNHPDFVPPDGNGLNPLLQNYWMVIHPPTLFLGFALTLVPFSYAIAGLWKGLYTEWVRPALPWALFAAMILGVGILMGGYWAYETLNFGGYWNWDPVENAVFAPWLILVAGIHTMIAYRNSGNALWWSFILITATFLAILYSTFLTRSGILGDSSVHSFTDLGLSGQLLVYLLTFIGLTIAAMWLRRKKIPATEKELDWYSRELWIFMGVAVLGLSAFQVLLTTSIPVYNALLKNVLGISSSIAPPANQEIFYSRIQIWFAIAIACFSAVGQFFWYSGQTTKRIADRLAVPAILAMLLTSLILLLGGFNTPGTEKLEPHIAASYILLVAAALYSVLANLIVLVQLLIKSPKLSGGAITHIGIATMLVGILFSSGYSKVISINMEGKVYSTEFSDEVNTENLLLFRDEAVKMKGYDLVYKGPRIEAKGFPKLVNKDSIYPTEDQYKVITRRALMHKGKTYFKSGDTIEVNPENTFYEITYQKENKEAFTLFPRLQENPQMGTVVSPDIQRFWNADFYSHLTVIPPKEEEREWTKPQVHRLKQKDTFFVDDQICVLEEIESIHHVPGVEMKAGDLAIRAHIRIYGKGGKMHFVHPAFILLVSQDNRMGNIPETLESQGLRFSLVHIEPETGTFIIESSAAQRDYVIIKVMEKPFINILWIGTLVVVMGMSIAIYRRADEFLKMRAKGQA